MTISHETAEFVLPGHPDTLCDAVVDSVVDRVRDRDPHGQCGLEAACGFDRIWLTGRIACSDPELLADLEGGAIEGLVRAAYASAGYGDERGAGVARDLCSAAGGAGRGGWWAVSPSLQAATQALP